MMMEIVMMVMFMNDYGDNNDNVINNNNDGRLWLLYGKENWRYLIEW